MITNPFFKEILSLSAISFGENYMTSIELKGYLNDPFTKVILKTQNNLLQGFSIVQLLDLIQLKKALFIDPNWIEIEFGSLQTIGYRKMIAVDKEFEGQGVASRLYQDGTNWLSEKTNVICSAVWIKKGEFTFEPILKKNGFEALKTVNNYWKGDSLKRNFNCPVCGEPPCLCDAIIYKKIITDLPPK